MLFKLKFTEVNNQIDANASEVDQLLVKVENLQEDNKKYQEYLQQLGAASKASESALEQLKNAFLMLQKIDTSQMEVLKQEVDNLYLQIKTNEMKSAEKLNSNSTPRLNNNLPKDNDQDVPQNKHTRLDKNKTNDKIEKKSAKSKESEAQAVEVEVLEPEEENKSHYDAVMKLKQLL